ncbi:MAG: hypothetical protein AAGI38_17880 [Bacteroidota bacterium]
MTNWVSYFEGSSNELAKQLYEAAKYIQEGHRLSLSDGLDIDSEKFHPVDRGIMANNWVKWLKAAGLRRRELEPLAYLKWLRSEQEKSIQGMVDSADNSPAFLGYAALLPLIREEIVQLQSGKYEQPDRTKLKQEVNRMILDGKLESALETTFEVVQSDSGLSHYETDLIHLISEFRYYEEKERRGVLDQENIRIARNKTRDTLLALIKEIGT